MKRYEELDAHHAWSRGNTLAKTGAVVIRQGVTFGRSELKAAVDFVVRSNSPMTQSATCNTFCLYVADTGVDT